MTFCKHINLNKENSILNTFVFESLLLSDYTSSSRHSEAKYTAGAVADNCRCYRWARLNVQITFKTVQNHDSTSNRILWQHVKHMYSNILCVQNQILHTRPLLCACSVGRHSFSTLLPVPDVLLCYAEYAQVAERRKGRKISRLFFSAYETNVWHSSEHSSAVGLSVKRRQ